MECNYQFGQSKIKIISNVSLEEKKANLKELYDTVNKIAENKRKQGINVDHWFYTQEELEELKRVNNNRLIY